MRTQIVHRALICQDTLLLALLHPETFDDVARGTRKHFASNRPRAVLFEGPPGCGKTTSARSALCHVVRNLQSPRGVSATALSVMLTANCSRYMGSPL